LAANPPKFFSLQAKPLGVNDEARKKIAPAAQRDAATGGIFWKFPLQSAREAL
jgi:hypothetical protein